MSARPSRLFLSLSIALLIAACGPAVIPSPIAAPTKAPSSESAAPSGEPVTSSPSASLVAGQTDSEWGRIWDAVPAGFPRFPGSAIADATGPEPLSARYGVPDGDAQAISTWMLDALETATFSTEGMNGPFEDGGFVIDSVGEGDCRIQTRIAPEGGTTFIEVLYGAGCPAPGL